MLLIAAASCEDREVKDVVPDSDMLLSDSAYANVSTDPFSIISATIDGDSLAVKLRFGGGCGSVEAKLYASSSVMESFPVQRNIKISFTDNDWCKASITRTFSFNIKPVRVDGNDQVMLRLEDWDTSLSYTY